VIIFQSVSYAEPLHDSNSSWKLHYEWDWRLLDRGMVFLLGKMLRLTVGSRVGGSDSSTKAMMYMIATVRITLWRVIYRLYISTTKTSTITNIWVGFH
jgi:hypothetical protein